MEHEAFFVYRRGVSTAEKRAVGLRLAEARRLAGLTQNKLAERLGVTTRTIQNYEAGIAVPYRHLRTIELLARKRPGWILEGGEDAELASTITALRDAMERHHILMESHLDEMRRHTGRLREQRRVSAERRAQAD